MILILSFLWGSTEACSGTEFGPDFLNIPCPSGQTRTTDGRDRNCFIVNSDQADVYRLMKVKLGVSDYNGNFGEEGSVYHISSKYSKDSVNVFKYKAGSFLVWDNRVTLAGLLEDHLSAMFDRALDLYNIDTDKWDFDGDFIQCKSLGFEDIKDILISECKFNKSGSVSLKILRIEDKSLETDVPLNYGSHAGMCGPQIWPINSVEAATSGRYKF
ncbi:hypothetical protein [Deinococcus sp. UYEF24]